MPKVSVLFWDIGGVLLSNAWDRAGRRAAAEAFGLDPAELERRHERVDVDFETGRLDLPGYLDRTVFDVPRPFGREAFVDFMRARSVGHPDALALARGLRASGRYTMIALNNESRELNEFRIERFGLREIFHAFLSSCDTRRRKPDPDAYRYALSIAQCPPGDSLFLDDRPENLAPAARLGIGTVPVPDPGRIGADLRALGVGVGTGGDR